MQIKEEITKAPRETTATSLNDFLKAIVRTVLLGGRKKAVHRCRVRLQQNQVAPMDSFTRILTGLLETAGGFANPNVNFC